ncbi:MAG: V-type ATP synthase subunit E [Coriobacteriia bacterium]|nr:V-type ATP synthase subunit E [Coriobacteriia bacterium]
MALEDIFRALEEQAQVECEEVLAAARAQAEAIAEEAVEKAESICSVCVDTSGAAVRLKASKRINEAKLQAKKRVSAVKEEAVTSAFEGAGERLGAIRGSAGYETLFKALLEEAFAGVEGEATVMVDPADSDLAKRVLASLDISAEVKPEITTAGGVIVASGGGRILRRNTLEDRLDKVSQYVQSEVAEILFT